MKLNLCDMDRLNLTGSPLKAISKKYMQEKKIVPGRECLFEFPHKITENNYIAICCGFMFGYGSKNDDHHIRKLSMIIHSEIDPDNDHCIKVTPICEMSDDSGHYMTSQGSDNSYVKVGVIALPDSISHADDDYIFEGLTGFDISYNDGDHHLQEISMFISSVNSKDTPEGAYIQDASGHSGKGKVFSDKLNIPQELLSAYQGENPFETLVYLTGYKCRNNKGDTHIRQLGCDPTVYDSKYGYSVLKDKHGNHVTPPYSIKTGGILVYKD
mgnify:CR=1 FL=1